MFTAILEQAKSAVQNRFIANAFFPSLVFWMLIGSVWVMGRGMGIEQLVVEWYAQDTATVALQSVAFVLWSFFFARLLDSQSQTILRLYEGYWRFPGGMWLHRYFRLYYQHLLSELDKRLEANPGDQDAYEEIYLRYPSRKDFHLVMPTRLGNILKNSEVYPRLRYGIDAVLVWPRLFNLLPDKYLRTYAGIRSMLDYMLVISLLSAWFALVTGVYLLIVGASWWMFLVCFWGGWLVAGVAYQGALGVAVTYAQQIKSGFDLYRNELLNALRIPLPDTIAEDQETWSRIEQYLYRNFPDPAIQYIKAGTTVSKRFPQNRPELVAVAPSEPPERASWALGSTLIVVVLIVGLLGSGSRYWLNVRSIASTQLQAEIVVAARDLAAFHQVGQTDVVTQTVSITPNELSFLAQYDQIVGSSTLRALPQGNTFPMYDLIDTSLISNTMLFSVDTTATLLPEDKLIPGSLVDLNFVGGACVLGVYVCPSIQGAVVLSVGSPEVDDINQDVTMPITLLVGIPDELVSQFITSSGRAQRIVVGAKP